MPATDSKKPRVIIPIFISVSRALLLRDTDLPISQVPRAAIAQIFWVAFMVTDKLAIIQFKAVPERIDVHVINRPGQPFLGSGGERARRLFLNKRSGK